MVDKLLGRLMAWQLWSFECSFELSAIAFTYWSIASNNKAVACYSMVVSLAMQISPAKRNAGQPDPADRCACRGKAGVCVLATALGFHPSNLSGLLSTIGDSEATMHVRLVLRDRDPRSVHTPSLCRAYAGSCKTKQLNNLEARGMIPHH